MAGTEKLQERLGEHLAPGETVRAGEVVMIQVTRANLGRAAATSTAISVAGALLGGGAVGFARMPEVWCVVTDRRVLILQKIGGYFRNPVGARLFSAPLDALTLDTPSGAMKSLVFRDRSDGSEIVQVKAGVGGGRKARAIAEAFAAGSNPAGPGVTPG